MSVSSEPITDPWPPSSLHGPQDSTLLQTYWHRPSKSHNACKTDEIIKILQEKTDLCLSNNKLFTLREDILPHLLNLRTLDLSSNFLSDLPESVSLLSHLETLNLSKNRFLKLPVVLQDLKSLKTLNLSENLLYDVAELAYLPGLVTLDLSTNKLVNLPKTFSLLTALKTLNLSSNSLKTLPHCIQHSLNNLETLDVSQNMRLRLNAPIFSQKLRVFKARRIFFCPAFPKWIFKCPRLEEVNFDSTRFERIWIPKMEEKITIRRLNLRKTHLTFHELRKILGNVKELEVLEIGNDHTQKYSKNWNLFTQWPMKLIKEPEKMVGVEMRSLELSFVPVTIQKFRNLRSIDLRRNRINVLPEDICVLEQLEVLAVSGNCLRKLPDGLKRMTGLRELRAGSNRIVTLPEGFGELRGIEVLDLYDNEILEAPEGVEQWEGLREFDFDMNFVDTEEIQTLKTPYKVLRSKLRENEDLRSSGRKIDNGRTISPEYQWSNHSSNDSLPTVSDNTCSEYTTEDWDDDSLDEFDVYNPPPVIPQQGRFDYVPNPIPKFIPNDIHPLPILQLIWAARTMGDYVPNPEIVEGQFDDDEDDV